MDCAKRKCEFTIAETAQIIGIFNGKEVKGKPWKYDKKVNRNAICEVLNENIQI